RARKITFALRVPSVGRTNCAHAAGVRTFVAIERTLVVARGREHAKGFSADERVHGTFASAQTFFDDDAPAGFTESALLHHRPNRLARIRTIVRHHDAFAKG